jgi:hypothetical protein
MRFSLIDAGIRDSGLDRILHEEGFATVNDEIRGSLHFGGKSAAFGRDDKPGWWVKENNERNRVLGGDCFLPSVEMTGLEEREEEPAMALLDAYRCGGSSEEKVWRVL